MFARLERLLEFSVRICFKFYLGAVGVGRTWVQWCLRRVWGGSGVRRVSVSRGCGGGWLEFGWGHEIFFLIM